MFDRSVVILLGLVSAAIYGIGVVFWVGVDNLSGQAWIEPVFWALATSGVVLLIVHDVYSWARSCVGKVMGMVKHITQSGQPGNAGAKFQ